jgi:hypothetical protein
LHLCETQLIDPCAVDSGQCHQYAVANQSHEQAQEERTPGIKGVGGFPYVSVMAVLKGAPICRLFTVSDSTLAPVAPLGNVWSVLVGRARLNPRWALLSLFDSARSTARP